MGYQERKRDFHEARWDEPIIMELGSPGRAGRAGSKGRPPVAKAAGTVEDLLPAGLKRKKAPKLPEMSQMAGAAPLYAGCPRRPSGQISISTSGLGTCTMKYSPKVNEQLVRSEKLQELHPCQDESTVQGILEVMYREAEYLKAISGMAKVSLQPSGGTQAIFANVETIRAYHEARGEGQQRNEIITTILSHPGNPGRRHIGIQGDHLYPDETGFRISRP